MDTPYNLDIRDRPELSLEQITSWYASHVAGARDLLPRIEGADTTADIYNYLTQNSLGKYLGMLANGGLGTYIGTQFADTTGNVTNQGNQDRTATGNLGTYAATRFNVLDQSDQGISITVQNGDASLGAWAGTLNQIVLTKVQTTSDNLGGYMGGQMSALGGQMGAQVTNLGTYVGGEFASLGGNLGSQVQNLGGYMGIQFGSSAAHTDTVVGNATDFLNDVLNGATNVILGSVENHTAGIPGSILNAVVGGAGVLGEGFKDALSWLMHGAFDDVFGWASDILSVPRKMLTGGYTGMDGILQDLHLDGDTGGFAQFLYSAAALVPTLISLVAGLGPIYAADALQNANKIVGPQLLSITDLRDGWLRGLVTDEELHDTLARLGFDVHRSGVISELFYDPAPPSDLVRFLVREVFNPQLRAELGLDSEYPDAADAEARKVGLSSETMRNYWAAHWNLPSPGQVYEMLHRGLVNADDVDSYLKVADFSPAWRRHLADISYNLPGRIDLRRMLAAGVIDEQRVLKGYQDLGYTPADAAALTQFAKKQAAGNITELPRGVVLDGYREGTLDRATAIAHLAQLGFNQPEAAFMLDLEDLKNARDLQGMNEDVIEADLKAGVITEPQAAAALNAIGVTPRRAQLLVALWRSRHAAKTATLTAGHIQHAAREHLIPDNFAFQRLQALGYNAGDAQLLIALAHPQAPADSPPVLTLSHLFRALREGLLTPAQLQERLTRKGYTPEDVRILIDLATPDLAAPEAAELTKAELIAAMKKGKLPIDAGQRRLAAKGYSAQDIDLLLETQGFNFTPTGELISYPRRDLTVAQLSKSFATGLLSEKDFRFRLGELAYADADIDLLVELATPAAPTGAPAQAAPPPPPTVPPGSDDTNV